ncbi:CPBP family intramembrane metalloprotease [bacterium]|nr:CPBP family intramembrane metalloprotease [bacterium]
MPAAKGAAAAENSAPRALLHFALLLLAWTGAWLLYLALQHAWPALSAGTPERVWWLSAKLLIWLAPCAFVLLREQRSSGRPWAAVLEDLGLGPGSLRRGLLWGLAAALLIAGLYWLSLPLGLRVLSSQWPEVFGAVALLGSLQAPLLEELLLRGFFQPRLERGYGRGAAIALSGLLFVALHLPGWYFQGQLAQPTLWLPLSLSILAIGLLCAWLRQRSNSLLAPVIAHWVNNLAASLLALP